MTDHVQIERRDGLLAVTLNRPERRNALTVAMYAALADAIEEAGRDESIRLIAIRGEGEDFTGGNDLGDFLNELPERHEDVPVFRLLEGLATNQVPIVAAVHGNAIGIGTTLLLHCDLVIAEQDARFLLPFVDLALVPEAASSLLLPRMAGRRHAARYLLLGEALGAEEARDIGLVSHVVDKGQLRSTLEAMVARLLSKPPKALRLTQALLRHAASDELVERMRLEAGHFSERLQSAEVKEAIAAFFEKRKPDFSSAGA
jgi:enoyl-CoA hydratase/carnithine racemase